MAMALIGSAWPSHSACIDGHPSVVQEYNKSYLIFIGEVISEKETEESGDYYDGTTYTLRIIELIKGTKRQFVDIFSENSSARFPMKIGNKYILLVYESDGRIEVDNCGNSGKLPQQDGVLKTLRELKEIEQGKGKE